MSPAASGGRFSTGAQRGGTRDSLPVRGLRSDIVPRMATSPAKKSAAKKKTAAKKTAAKKTAALPKELAARAKAQHDAKLARLAERARDAIARIRERQADIAANMVDIGLALVELKADGMAEALGRSGFAEVCEKDLRMPLSTANSLVALATKVPREIVTSLGPDRARAVLELVEATPEDDTPDDVLHAKLALPSGRTLDVAAASTHELREAAKEFRDARPAAEGKRSRGFTSTSAEKKSFKSLAKHLTERGHAGAKLVATRDGKGAKVRFEVRLSEIDAFATALRAARKG